MHRLSAFSIIRLFIRTPSILCFILFCDTAIAARISGKVVDVQGSPVANLTVHADDPVQGCQFCSTVAVANTDAQGNFEFELPALRYVLFAFVPPPYTIPRYLADARDGDVTGIQLVIDKTRRPLYPDIPPNAQLINLGTPNAIGEAEVTGQAGSVLPSSVVILVNLDTGHLGHTTADKNGAFNATLIAFPGNSVVVKADPLGYAAHTWLSFSPPEIVGGNDQLTTIPGTILHVPHPDGFTGPTGTADAGLAKHQYKETDQEPPAWVFTGKSNRVDFSPGDTLNIQGRFELVSPALSGTADRKSVV